MKRFQLFLEPSALTKLEKMAKKQRVSVAKLIREAIAAFIDVSSRWEKSGLK